MFTNVEEKKRLEMCHLSIVVLVIYVHRQAFKHYCLSNISASALNHGL